MAFQKLALFFQIAHQRNSGFTLIFPFAFLLLPFPKIGFVFHRPKPLKIAKYPINLYYHLTNAILSILTLALFFQIAPLGAALICCFVLFIEYQAEVCHCERSEAISNHAMAIL